jgi:hypothetical protein
MGVIVFVNVTSSLSSPPVFVTNTGKKVGLACEEVTVFFWSGAGGAGLEDVDGSLEFLSASFEVVG